MNRRRHLLDEPRVRPSGPSALAVEWRRWIFGRARIYTGMSINSEPRPVVHLELHTPDRNAAGDFYARLLHWRAAMGSPSRAPAPSSGALRRPTGGVPG